jgi:glycosyltransferase involved in cell wall biosynthesis
MRILQTPVRLFTTGGVENYVCQLSKELVDRGHEVKVICAQTPGEQKVDDRISVSTLRTLGKIANTNITPALPLALMQEDFDILHTHLPTPWSADWSMVAALIKRRHLVLTYHNDIVGEGTAGHIARVYNRTALKLLLKASDRIIVARHSHLPTILEGYTEKISIIPVGIDARIFRPKEVSKLGDIFFLSVLDEYHRYKGLEHLMGALKILKHEVPNVKLVVGGSGALVNHYRQLARSQGIEENVVFAGFIPANKLVDYYNGCQIFVLPSTDPSREGFGIVPLEAMACGKPVITTDIIGAADNINKWRAGLVVNRGDEKELAEAILSILMDEALTKRMGFSGRRLVEEKYSWRSVAGQIETIYEELV